MDSYVYIYTKDINKEFAGIVKSINESDIVILEDKNKNITNIPLAEISIVTERL